MKVLLENVRKKGCPLLQFKEKWKILGVEDAKESSVKNMDEDKYIDAGKTLKDFTLAQ